MIRKISYSFQDGPRVLLRGKGKELYDVSFIDQDNERVVYQVQIPPTFFAKCSQAYFTNWKIEIKHHGELVEEHYYQPKEHVFIKITSPSLGDNIAWIPYIEAFRQKWGVNVYCYTNQRRLFAESYPHIRFITNERYIPKDHDKFTIGIFNQRYLAPSNHRFIPLQQVAAEALGLLPFEELQPALVRDSRPPIIDHPQYVVIGSKTTSKVKFWNYPNGWEAVVKSLQKKGYKVINLGINLPYEGVVNYTSALSFDDLKNIIQHAQFLVGLSSGLSWLAWALDKKIVMISGWTLPFHEFQHNNWRVINTKVCYGCHSKEVYEHVKTANCPEHFGTPRQFECSHSITPKQVIAKITQLEKSLPKLKLEQI